MRFPSWPQEGGGPRCQHRRFDSASAPVARSFRRPPGGPKRAPRGPNRAREDSKSAPRGLRGPNGGSKRAREGGGCR
eukprot:6804493-Pyramimonas_sp.AAC.2